MNVYAFNSHVEYNEEAEKKVKDLQVSIMHAELHFFYTHDLSYDYATTVWLGKLFQNTQL